MSKDLNIRLNDWFILLNYLNNISIIYYIMLNGKKANLPCSRILNYLFLLGLG